VPPSASIVVPTRDRPAYLEVTLGSLAAQAAAAGAEVLVVDDGSPELAAATRALAERHGARYLPNDRPGGLNVARNTGVAHAGAPLIVFLDDDVEADRNWLPGLLRAAAAEPSCEVFAGRIRVRLEGRPPRSCGREGPPITFLDLGEQDRDAEFAWGANMAIRRAALARLGPFDPAIAGCGDEEEWQRRHKALGGRVRYVAAAEVVHRRTAPDATLRALARAAWRRGRASRAFDVRLGRAPSPARELRTLAGCLWHAARRRCPMALVLAAHSAGRLREVR